MNALKENPPIAYGDPWIIDRDHPASVPIPLPVIIVGVEGPYTEQDRKFWTFLVHAVWDEIGEKLWHEVPIREIDRVFRQLSGRHHTDWIWESATRLADTKVRWIRTEGDRRYRGIGHLLAAETDENGLVRQDEKLRFSFAQLVPILKDPRRFARLRTHVMIRLSGKYTVTLYELLESVANMRTPRLEGSIPEIRQWLKVPDGKMTRWQDLRRFVLEPAVKQLNYKPDEGTGFTTRMQPVKKGRSIQGVHFTVEKTKARLCMEAEIRAHENQLSLPLEKSEDEVILETSGTIAPETLQNARKADADIVQALMAAGLGKRDAQKIAHLQWEYVDAKARPADAGDDPEAAFTHYVREKIHLLKQRKEQGKVKSATGFLLKAIRENWANPDFAEQEKKSAENRAFMQQRIIEEKKQKLEEERNRIIEERDAEKRPVCEALLTPDLADALRSELVEHGRYSRSLINRSLSALENYKDSPWLAVAMDAALEERYPDRFKAINDDYQPRLAALDQQIVALG